MKHLFVTDDRFQLLGWVLWACMDGCSWLHGQGLGPLTVSSVRWERVLAHQSAWSPGHQQAGSKAPHLWPQGSPNIRSILFRNLLLYYILMRFYRFPAVTIYCFPNKKFKRPNQPLVSYPSFKDVVSAESLGLGSFNYTLQRGLLQLSSSPGDEFLPFTVCTSKVCSQRMTCSTGVIKPKVTSLTGNVIQHIPIMNASLITNPETQVCLVSCLGVLGMLVKPPPCFRARVGWTVCESLLVKV